jgi:hypothetical protein
MNFQSRFKGREGLIPWPARRPDLKLLTLFPLWPCERPHVQPCVNTLHELTALITIGTVDIINEYYSTCGNMWSIRGD